MLTYVYRCKSCEEKFKIEQSIKDDAFTDCPFCKEGKLQRLISGGSGFILKGGGWHSDLYSKPPSKKKIKGDEPKSKNRQ
jgi:putative FmdB family regulatory protein